MSGASPAPSAGEAWRITPEALATIRSHAVEAAPRECCGLLLGEAGHIVSARRARNDDPSPNRYLVHPPDHFAALRQARALGLVVLGAYHSHPGSAASPSATDRRDALSELLYVIAGPVDVQPIAVTAWRLEHGNFHHIPLVPVE